MIAEKETDVKLNGKSTMIYFFTDDRMTARSRFSFVRQKEIARPDYGSLGGSCADYTLGVAPLRTPVGLDPDVKTISTCIGHFILANTVKCWISFNGYHTPKVFPP